MTPVTIFGKLITEHNIADSVLVTQKDILAIDDHLCVLVPSGTTTNMASIPKLLASIYPRHGRYSYPSVFHDHLYAKAGKVECISPYFVVEYTRHDADKWLYRLMRSTGCRIYTCIIFYLAVRMFGWLSWKKS